MTITQRDLRADHFPDVTKISWSFSSLPQSEGKSKGEGLLVSSEFRNQRQRFSSAWWVLIFFNVHVFGLGVILILMSSTC